MNSIEKSGTLEMSSRYIKRNQSHAIKTVYQALVELITNADDRYQVLDHSGIGLIEIEYESKRNGNSTIRVRDNADGMNYEQMEQKICTYGDQVSGLAEGMAVRGTNSRGAKDIAALGKVIFESIPEGKSLYVCEIDGSEYKLHTPQPITPEIRSTIGIKDGTGTRVTIELNKTTKLPYYKTLKKELSCGVAISEILFNKNRSVRLIDKSGGKIESIELKRPVINGKERVSTTFLVPGYPYKAKLKLYRSPKTLEPGKDHRLSGIRVKSKHAVHESTMFDPKLEFDPIALHFYGVLHCPGIDELWNQYDEYDKKGQNPPKTNPVPILDCTRKTGLERAHPFFKALQGEVLTHLRKLIDEERKNNESGQRQIASKKTKRDLGELGKLCSKFLAENTESLEDTKDPNSIPTGGDYYDNGYQLNPPIAKLVIGDRKRFYLNVIKREFPELTTGDEVQIGCSKMSTLNMPKVGRLEDHPNQPGVLRTIFFVEALAATSKCDLTVDIGSINAISKVEVLSSEAERYASVNSFRFMHKTNSIPVDANKKKKKAIELFAPLDIVSSESVVEISCSNSKFGMKHKCVLKPEPSLGVAKGVIHVCCPEPDLSGELIAVLKDYGDKATTELVSKDPGGFRVKPEIVDEDMKSFKYIWDPKAKGVLKIAAQHKLLQRYLGDSKIDFPGQHELHFKVLLAEIVVEAVCTKILKTQSNNGTIDTNDWDTDDFMSELNLLALELAPLAHEILIPTESIVSGSKSR